MALVLLSDGVTELPSTARGEVAYVRGGSVVLRRVVKPVDPMTESQLRERNGVSSGARQWSYDLSPAERASFEAIENDCGLSGYWLWVWLWSLMTFVGEWIEPGEASAVQQVPVVDDCELDVDAETMTMTVSAGGAGAASFAAISVGRPLSPGRVARRSDMRSLGSFPLATSNDLLPAYLATFGRSPVEGQAFAFALRVGSPDDLEASCEVEGTCVGGCSVGGFAVPNPESLASGVDYEGEATLSWCLSGEVDGTVSIDDSSGDLELISSDGFSGEGYGITISNSNLSGGVYSFNLVFVVTSQSSPDITIPLTITWTGEV